MKRLKPKGNSHEFEKKLSFFNRNTTLCDQINFKSWLAVGQQDLFRYFRSFKQTKTPPSNFYQDERFNFLGLLVLRKLGHKFLASIFTESSFYQYSNSVQETATVTVFDTTICTIEQICNALDIKKATGPD